MGTIQTSTSHPALPHERIILLRIATEIADVLIALLNDTTNRVVIKVLTGRTKHTTKTKADQIDLTLEAVLTTQLNNIHQH